ncbi:MAG: tryptophanase [Bacillota bacterium]
MDWSKPVNAEPFRIKMVEPVRMTSRAERERLIAAAGYNLFALDSKDIFIDLLTDSGTGAMSDRQWAGIMQGDEAYAGSRNFFHFKETIEKLLGFPYVIPTHQGRAAENVLFTTLLREGQVVPNNMHFDTTKAHVEHKRGKARNFVCPEGLVAEEVADFKGNMDLEKLDRFMAENGKETAPFIMLTITCNSNGGQPVSMENIRGVRRIADKHGVPLFFDCARFAENAYFIKEREPGYAQTPVREIVREMLSYADGCTMSAKKDALVNIGGFLAMRSEELYQQAIVWAVLFEGFPTYGGLAGRDLEAMARGLQEVVEEDYLRYRIGQVAYLGALLNEAGVPIVLPTGGHAVYLDAKRFLPHLPPEQFPAQALTVELYREGGVRGVEIGSLLAGRDPETGKNIHPELEMVRLTIPRRTYTDRHMEYVAQTVVNVFQRRESIGGLELVHEPPVLRHFTCRLQPVV